MASEPVKLVKSSLNSNFRTVRPAFLAHPVDFKGRLNASHNRSRACAVVRSIGSHKSSPFARNLSPPNAEMNSRGRLCDFGR
jgi:hypothetical protein